MSVGYNLTSGGNRGIRNKGVGINGHKGKKHSVEAKKKIGDANRGNKNGMFGKRFKKTKEEIEKNRLAIISSEKFQASRKSDEYRRKISLFQNRGGWVLLDVNFKLIEEFDTKMDITKKLGCCSGNVKKARQQNRIICKKYRVMYKKDYNIAKLQDIEAPYKTILKRNHDRPYEAQLPTKALEKMIDNLEVPATYESPHVNYVIE